MVCACHRFKLKRARKTNRERPTDFRTEVKSTVLNGLLANGLEDVHLFPYFPANVQYYCTFWVDCYWQNRNTCYHSMHAGGQDWVSGDSPVRPLAHSMGGGSYDFCVVFASLISRYALHLGIM